MRDARAHHAGTEHADLGVLLQRDAGRARGQLVGFLHAEEQAADHVLRHRRHHEVGEVARLDREAGVEVGRQALIDAGQDVLGRRVVVVGLFAQHGVGRHQHLHAARRGGPPPGILKPLASQGCSGLAAGGDGIEHPGRAAVRSVADFHHGMDQADLLRLGGLDALAFHEQRRSRLHADQARHALRAAGAGQQPQRDFGEAEARLRVVGGDAVMAGQRDSMPPPSALPLSAAATGLPPSSMPRIRNLCHSLIDAWKAAASCPGEFGEVAAGDEVLLRRGRRACP
jgi:hypothetical protein